LDAVRDALLQDPLLQNCTIKEIRKGEEAMVRAVTVTPHGVIRVSVTDGVVLLDDHVLTHTQKRMAGPHQLFEAIGLQVHELCRLAQRLDSPR